MAQIFHPATNHFSRFSLAALVLVLAGGGFLLRAVYRSDYVTGAHVVREQPIPFSHEHHVGGLGIDCRYCHTSVESSSFAGIPDTQTCMTCHSQVWTEAPVLEPLRRAWKEDRPVEWVRVHDLPDFVYFDHSIHVAKGVGCVECHGRVDKMPLMWQEATLQMEWCVKCHRHPEPRRRKLDEVFLMGPAKEKARPGGFDPFALTNCSVCHR
jgi:hypothetical protein